MRQEFAETVESVDARLIERWLPITALGIESVREGTAVGGIAGGGACVRFCPPTRTETALCTRSVFTGTP